MTTNNFKLVQRILSDWQFDLLIFLIALLPKPRRSHHYACVCEVALSEKSSAPNYPKLNFRCTRLKKNLRYFNDIIYCILFIIFL